MENKFKIFATGVLAVLASHTIAQNKNKMESSELKTATFGARCFWCTEAGFLNVNGVTKVVSGYSGGKEKNTTYKEVCTGLTGHGEETQMTYDTKKAKFQKLLED